MKEQKIFCLGISGLPLSDAACDALFRTACLMAKKKLEERKVAHDDVEGVVQTDFECSSMGSVSGMIFRADISTEQGVSKASYIVRHNDLDGYEKAKWHHTKVSIPRIGNN